MEYRGGSSEAEAVAVVTKGDNAQLVVVRVCSIGRILRLC
jgi:hypothetical protein